MTGIHPDDLLVLLEDGPHSTQELAQWLKCTQVALVPTLRRMARLGQVRREQPSGRWHLPQHVPPTAAVAPVRPERRTVEDAVYPPNEDLDDPDADVVDDLLTRRPGRPRTRVEVPRRGSVPKDAQPAWWVGKSREELNATAAAKAAEMSASPEGRKVTAWRPSLT